VNPFDVTYRNKYIWNQEKNRINKNQHGIKFEDAVEVFDDPFAVQEYDDANSAIEERFNIVGKVKEKWLVVTVTWTPRGELIRIISARPADSLEKEAYDEKIKEIIG
jgi:uncharacterized DUF497 family protein